MDRDLQKLKQLSANDFPLPIRLFNERLKTRHPIEAIEKECSDIIRQYRELHGITKPISLKWLCKILNIEITGKIPTKTHKSQYYQSWVQPFRSDIVEGKLLLKNGTPHINLPYGLHLDLARFVVAHEIGHWILYKHLIEKSPSILQRGSTPEEEYLACYAARRLLIPDSSFYEPASSNKSLSYKCILATGRARVTLYTATLRFGDYDICSTKIDTAILWKINPSISKDKPVFHRLTPQWFCSREKFIPVGKCRARENSIIEEMAKDSSKACYGNRIEKVDIGELNGEFNVDAYSWGSIKDGTRLVLSIFEET